MSNLKVLYDFQAENSEELTAKEGDFLTGVIKTVDSLWWVAEDVEGMPSLLFLFTSMRR